MLPAGSARKNRLFCSKFWSDTLILLKFCSVSEKILGPPGRIQFFFANVEWNLGLTPKN